VHERNKLTLSAKLSRLAGRLRDPEWRRYARTLVLGKALGICVVLMAMVAIPTAVSILPSLTGGTVAVAEDAKPADPAAPAAAADPAKPADAAKPADTAVKAADAAPPGAPAPAAPAPDPYAALKPADHVNAINTVWTLIAAFLVFGMQVGFTMLEAGFCRSRETVNVLVECVFDTCLCGILFWAWGYAFMFGAGNGFIGWHDPTDAAGAATKSWFFLQNIDASTTYNTTGVALLAHWIFQFAFADCASTICSGAMIGRTAFWGDILYSVCVSGFIYPIIGHWAWGPDGFLATMGSADHFLPGVGTFFHDFAGSTVVHTIGGSIALAGAIMLGPRLGRKFKRDGGGPMMPHDLTIAVCGGLLLWFGWYGFNPGSTLSAIDIGGIGRISANTTLAACAAGLSAIFLVYFRSGKWDAGSITNGFLAGLVAITCPCYWVSPLGAVILGGIAGIIAILVTDALEFLRIDDPIGAVPVHFANGIWGTLSLGFFATGEYGITGPTGADTSAGSLATGLFYGAHPWNLLEAQIIGSATITIATFVTAIVVFKVLDIMGVLRISREGELEGMDIHEHGISAYPEYVISALAAPSGMPADTVHHAGVKSDKFAVSK
jgi:Amt family ammonium transporter